MIHVERSFHNRKVVSIDDEIIFMYGWANPNDGVGTPAGKGTIFIQKTCSEDSAVFWLKYSSDNPKSWVTWGEGQPRLVKTFGYDGNAVAGKWLEVFHSIPSNLVPFPVSENGVVRAVNVQVETNTTATFELYKNAVLLDTLTLTAASYVAKINLAYPVVRDDKFSVTLASGSAKNIGYNLFVQIAMVP